MVEWVVAKSDQGQRLDRFLSSKKAYHSRSEVKKAFDQGLVSCKGKGKLALDYKVQLDDCFVCGNLSEPKYNLEPVAGPLTIYYEDEALLVVEKPAGLLTHPSPTKNEVSLVHYLMHHSELAEDTEVYRPGIVHRLDKSTSGLLIVAKSNQCLRALKEQFQLHSVEKMYLALVAKQPTPTKATINLPIGRHPVDRKKFAVTPKGKQSLTHYETLASNNKYSLLSIKLETGRTHQIRVHLQHIGCPIVGDLIYGSNKNKLQSHRQFLHAYKISFTHPFISTQSLQLLSPLPTDLVFFLSEVMPEALPIISALYKK